MRPVDSKTLRTAYRRQPDIVPREIAGETILVPVRGELAHMRQIFVLNPVAEHIWHSLDGSKAVQSILTEVMESFEIDRDTARSDLLEFLAELEEAGLIAKPASATQPDE